MQIVSIGKYGNLVKLNSLIIIEPPIKYPWFHPVTGVVGCGEGVVYLISLYHQHVQLIRLSVGQGLLSL